jgi:hypothetical protein
LYKALAGLVKRYPTPVPTELVEVVDQHPIPAIDYALLVDVPAAPAAYPGSQTINQDFNINEQCAKCGMWRAVEDCFHSPGEES